MVAGWLKKILGISEDRTAGKAKTSEESVDPTKIEDLAKIQEENAKTLVRAMLAAGPGLVSWAMTLQQRFSEVLEEKESYIADRSALPYPEAWLRLAFKVQALRCVLSDQEDLLPAIHKALEHLASFQTVNPADIPHLALVERYREEVRARTFAPDSEDDTVLSDGSSLREVLKGYTRALPTFNRYHDAIRARQAQAEEELSTFIHEVRALHHTA